MRKGTELKRWLCAPGVSCALLAASAAAWSSGRASAGDCAVGAGTRLIAPDLAAFDLFGQAVAIDGDTMVVGAWNDETPIVSGSAYVYQRQAGVWQFVTKLLPPDGAAFDRFGWSVDIDADTIAIGADSDDAPQVDRGSVYVFVRVAGAWQFQQKLTALGGIGGDRLGTSVSVKGDTLIAGAPGNDEQGPNAGGAFVFVRSGAVWTEEALLSDPNAIGGENFGAAVAVDGDLALAGANLSDVAGVNAGAVIPFSRSAGVWTPEAPLSAAPLLSAGDQFGISLALAGDAAIVGAPFSNAGGTDTGRAFFYRRTSGAWGLIDTLRSPTPANNDQFGISVALSADAAVVGLLFGDTGGVDSGGAMVFLREENVFAFSGALSAPEVSTVDQFGISVAISTEAIAVGASQDDAGAANSGAAFVFALNCGGLPGDMNCDGVVSVGDISGFVLALTDPAGYAAAFPSCDINNADVNNDTIVSVGDIGPFVQLLTGG